MAYYVYKHNKTHFDKKGDLRLRIEFGKNTSEVCVIANEFKGGGTWIEFESLAEFEKIKKDWNIT